MSIETTPWFLLENLFRLTFFFNLANIDISEACEAKTQQKRFLLHFNVVFTLFYLTLYTVTSITCELLFSEH